MARVTVKHPLHQYDVIIEPGAMERIGDYVKELVPHRRCAMFSDVAVDELYGDKVKTDLEESGYEVNCGVMPSGEECKTLATVKTFYDRLVAEKTERGSPVIAMGGGVTGDTVGFVAATYLRGLPLIHCPTTLLAMVDSSVGGKVGVNLAEGKNLIGSFHQPECVIIDPLVLKTLPDRELLCGLAECVKHGVIRDKKLFDWTENNVQKIMDRDPEVLTKLIERNVQVKASVVMEDEREGGVRMHLNYGHTFAHVIEATSGYGKILHGEAVSVGMVAAAKLSARLGRCSEKIAKRLEAVLERIGLPTRCPLAKSEDLIRVMRYDKKVKNGKVQLILPDSIGSVSVVSDVDEDDVRAAWDDVRQDF